jgi:hypothetical protein
VSPSSEKHRRIKGPGALHCSEVLAPKTPRSAGVKSHLGARRAQVPCRGTRVGERTVYSKVLHATSHPHCDSRRNDSPREPQVCRLCQSGLHTKLFLVCGMYSGLPDQFVRKSNTNGLPCQHVLEWPKRRSCRIPSSGLVRSMELRRRRVLPSHIRTGQVKISCIDGLISPRRIEKAVY